MKSNFLWKKNMFKKYNLDIYIGIQINNPVHILLYFSLGIDYFHLNSSDIYL